MRVTKATATVKLSIEDDHGIAEWSVDLGLSPNCDLDKLPVRVAGALQAQIDFISGGTARKELEAKLAEATKPKKRGRPRKERSNG